MESTSSGKHRRINALASEVARHQQVTKTADFRFNSRRLQHASQISRFRDDQFPAFPEIVSISRQRIRSSSSVPAASKTSSRNEAGNSGCRRGRRTDTRRSALERLRFSSFGLALDFRLSLGLGRRATPEPADHTDCRHADYTAPQPFRLTRPGMIRFEQFAIGVRRRRRDDRSWACPSLRSGNPTADVAERL